jgi:hypothetical protein
MPDFVPTKFSRPFNEVIGLDAPNVVNVAVVVAIAAFTALFPLI